jgi:hypothetical protein
MVGFGFPPMRLFAASAIQFPYLRDTATGRLGAQRAYGATD